jgi:hypothetical protein
MSLREDVAGMIDVISVDGAEDLVLDEERLCHVCPGTIIRPFKGRKVDSTGSLGRKGIFIHRRQRYEKVFRLIGEWETTDKSLEVQYCYDVDQNGKLLVSYDPDYEQSTLEISRDKIV